jgi:hypothetical protein
VSSKELMNESLMNYALIYFTFNVLFGFLRISKNSLAGFLLRLQVEQVVPGLDVVKAAKAGKGSK